MKRENIVRKIIQVLLVCLMPVCCTVAAKYRGEYGTPGKEAQSVPRSESTGGEAAAELNEVKDSESIDEAKDSESAGKSTDETDDTAVEEKHSLIPVRCEWQEGDMDYDPRDTIYYKTYYDDFVRGYIKHIEYPDINIRGELEDYFRSEEYDFKRWDNLVEMFFDSRTIETPEEELKELFYQHGYLLCFQNAEMKNLHVRFVEITEIGGLSLYPSRIMIQTWDENCIYLQDITSPIPRKVMGIFAVDNREPYHMIVHSSGLSRDYVDEQELSFWEYLGDYWALVPMDLEIDTSHAHISGENFYPDLDRDELFEAFYYRDGIAYRSSRQNDCAVNTYTVKLGKMEEVQKNRIFRLEAVYESEQLGTVEWGGTYLEFEVKQNLPYITRECLYNDGGIFLYYLQLSGMEDSEKERRINTLLLEDVMKIAERDDPCLIYDYEIEHKDDRFIRILYKDIQGGTIAAATLDIEEEKVLTSDN